MKVFLYLVGLFVTFQQVLADFTISLDGITQIPITNIANLPPNVDAVTSCQRNCTSMIDMIQSCTDDTNDAACFCTPDLQGAMKTCEQCMFNFLVAKNIKSPSPIVGSNPALAGLFGACAKENINLTAAALELPPNWTGPVGVHLKRGETILVVGTGAFLGMAAMYTLFNIS